MLQDHELQLTAPEQLQFEKKANPAPRTGAVNRAEKRNAVMKQLCLLCPCGG